MKIKITRKILSDEEALTMPLKVNLADFAKQNPEVMSELEAKFPNLPDMEMDYTEVTMHPPKIKRKIKKPIIEPEPDTDTTLEEHPVPKPSMNTILLKNLSSAYCSHISDSDDSYRRAVSHDPYFWDLGNSSDSSFECQRGDMNCWYTGD